MASLAALLPINPSRILIGFTTFPCSSNAYPDIQHVPLADDILGVHKVSPHTSHMLVVLPATASTSSESARDKEHAQRDELAWEAFFPRGSINPGNTEAPPGGFGFYLHGPDAFAASLKTPGAQEAVMGYEVLFEEGWKWVRGGKLPGIYGGVGEQAYGCTGGRKTERCKCFDLRLMWRSDGLGELYAYLPQVASNTARLLAVPPRSTQNPDYGFSVGRGAWRFEAGKWTAVAQRVKMNGVGRDDGEVEVFINGKSVIHVTGLILRSEGGTDSRVHGLHFQTFFGGHTPEWASPRDQRAWFRRVSGAVLRPVDGHDEL